MNILVVTLSCMMSLSLTLDASRPTRRLFWFRILRWVFVRLILWRRLRVLRLFLSILFVRVVVLLGLVEKHIANLEV